MFFNLLSSSSFAVVVNVYFKTIFMHVPTDQRLFSHFLYTVPFPSHFRGTSNQILCSAEIITIKWSFGFKQIQFVLVIVPKFQINFMTFTTSISQMNSMDLWLKMFTIRIVFRLSEAFASFSHSQI